LSGGGWFGLSAAQDQPLPRGVLVYGIVVDPTDPARLVERPDISAIRTRRYAEKGSSAAVLEIIAEADRVLVRFLGTDIPPVDVVFDQKPQARSLMLVFKPDRVGRPVLTGFVSGDVGAEVNELP
jgi:hypothetical protein